MVAEEVAAVREAEARHEEVADGVLRVEEAGLREAAADQRVAVAGEDSEVVVVAVQEAERSRVAEAVRVADEDASKGISRVVATEDLCYNSLKCIFTCYRLHGIIPRVVSRSRKDCPLATSGFLGLVDSAELAAAAVVGTASVADGPAPEEAFAVAVAVASVPEMEFVVAEADTASALADFALAASSAAGTASDLEAASDAAAGGEDTESAVALDLVQQEASFGWVASAAEVLLESVEEPEVHSAAEFQVSGRSKDSEYRQSRLRQRRTAFLRP